MATRQNIQDCRTKCEIGNQVRITLVILIQKTKKKIVEVDCRTNLQMTVMVTNLLSGLWYWHDSPKDEECCTHKMTLLGCKTTLYNDIASSANIALTMTKKKR